MLAMCLAFLICCAYQCQCAVSAHAVSGNADFAGIKLLELREQRLGQLFCDIRVHVVAFCPWLLSRVDVETCA
jgi:hypothetical protein